MCGRGYAHRPGNFQSSVSLIVGGMEYVCVCVCVCIYIYIYIERLWDSTSQPWMQRTCRPSVNGSAPVAFSSSRLLCCSNRSPSPSSTSIHFCQQISLIAAGPASLLSTPFEDDESSISVLDMQAEQSDDEDDLASLSQSLKKIQASMRSRENGDRGFLQQNLRQKMADLTEILMEMADSGGEDFGAAASMRWDWFPHALNTSRPVSFPSSSEIDPVNRELELRSTTGSNEPRVPTMGKKRTRFVLGQRSGRLDSSEHLVVDLQLLLESAWLCLR
ncbi:hypothetical protein C1H46_027744 [Malus baccata]|uniref:Uncharacterized protein n=1 Tax=Malus baccata TaxID=106549 RepID=A0A540LJS0_MALBA|nr:hypothetical protein C1H46_027744 [Malus baccata]